MSELDEILLDKSNLENYLKKKKLALHSKYKDEEYPDSSFFEIGQKRLLAVVSCTSESEVKNLKNHFLIDRGLSHCAILYQNKIIFCRSYGERKHFVFSDRNKDNISKQDKIRRIDEDIDILFQSKDISRMFYDAFKVRRDYMVQKMEANLDPIRKFLIAQKIFDRIFFIYFLCHKGIVKFDDEHEISGKTLFNILNETGDLYSNLFSLFKKFSSEELSFQINEYKFFIPYLNGGIFRIDEDEEKISIDLTKKEWKEIFDFLNGYHWLIEDDIENLTEDEYDEKILTPEILGHIYERSVVEWELKGFKNQAEESAGIKTERKKKGVYYTPEDITEFICFNSLYYALAKKLNVSYSEILKILESATNQQYKHVLNALETIRVIDPACGSGAFLVKMAELLFRFRIKILSKLKQKYKYYDIKKDIIVNNIYGVDILQGAAEIAKLRLWLWLVSSYSETKEIQPLPNIEYNIIVGNSLIGWIDETVSITFDRPLTPEIEGIFEGIKVHSSKQIRKTYESAEELFQTFKLDNYIDAYSLLHDVYKNSHGETATQLKKILTKIKKSIYKSISQSIIAKVNENIPKKQKIYVTQFEQLNPFHWKFDFGDIIKEGGFDIIIGNPPYGDTLTDTEKMIIAKLYGYKMIQADENGKGTNNSSAIFLERVFTFLKNDGILGFILPSSIARTQEFSKLRRFLKKQSLRKLSEVGKAFEEVGLEMMILLIQKTSKKEESIVLSYYDGKFKDGVIPSTIYDERDVFLTMIDNEKYDIIKKIEADSTKLSSFGDMPRGFTLSKSEYFENPSKDVVLVLSGANLFRFGLKDGPKRKPNRYLHKKNELLNNDIFGRLRIVYQNVASSLPRIIATIESNNRPTDDTVNNLIINDPKFLKPILLILNSNLTTFYLKYALINCSKLTVHLDAPYIGQIVIKKNIDLNLLTKICDYLLILNCQFYYNTVNDKDTNEIRKQIQFFTDIGNFLVYETYLEHQLGNGLSELIRKIDEIKTDRIICGHETITLSVKVPEQFLQKISKVYVELNKNDEIKKSINQIKKHAITRFLQDENVELIAFNTFLDN